MKKFTGKTVDECVSSAALELGVEPRELVFEVEEEKKGLFKKTATIKVYEKDDAATFGEEYLKNALEALGIPSEVTSINEDEIIKMTINSERNPVLIGKGGRTLQALNELVKLAVSNKFRHRYRILLDVNGYKEDKYDRITHIARRAAKEVQRTHVNVQLDPMTPDERRVVHNALSGWENIKTESSGEGKDRAVSIIYVE